MVSNAKRFALTTSTTCAVSAGKQYRIRRLWDLYTQLYALRDSGSRVQILKAKLRIDAFGAKHVGVHPVLVFMDYSTSLTDQTETNDVTIESILDDAIGGEYSFQQLSPILLQPKTMDDGSWYYHSGKEYDITKSIARYCQKFLATGRQTDEPKFDLACIFNDTSGSAITTNATFTLVVDYRIIPNSGMNFR
jgi:hypothetical protein